VVHEPDGPKAYGAGILSSYGEIEEFVEADLRPLDVARMGVQTYDITHYQPILFAAESWQQVHDVVGGFFDTATDESVEALLHASTAVARG
jgi:phenylalanine-4-hydroxylase